MRRHFGIRNKAAYKEAWLGGSISQKHVTYYSRSNNCKEVYVSTKQPIFISVNHYLQCLKGHKIVCGKSD